MSEKKKKLSTLEGNLKQIEEIHKHRWISSQKFGYDVGEEWAALDWCKNYSKIWREEQEGTPDERPEKDKDEK